MTPRDARNEGLDDEGEDIPPTGGFREPERRHFPRRTEDKLSHDMESWVAHLFVDKGRLMFAVGALSSLFTAIGFRIVGPTADIKALDAKFTAKDSIMNVRMTRMEDSQGQIKEQLASIAESMHFLTYMACQATDKDRRPNTCYVVAKEIP